MQRNFNTSSRNVASGWARFSQLVHNNVFLSGSLFSSLCDVVQRGQFSSLTKSIAASGNSNNEGFQLRIDSAVKKLILIKMRALFNVLISRTQKSRMYACVNYVTYLTQYILHISVKRFEF